MASFKDNNEFDNFVSLYGYDSGVYFNINTDSLRTKIHNLVLKNNKYFKNFFTFSEEFFIIFATSCYFCDKYSKQINDICNFKDAEEFVICLSILLWRGYFLGNILELNLQNFKQEVKNNQENLKKINNFYKQNSQL